MKKNFFHIFILLFFNVLLAQTNSINKNNEIESIVSRIEVPVFSNYKVLVTKFGAKGDSITDCKKAFDKAMKACKRNNGGVIIVPKGIYTINGPIHFISNVNLHLEEGAKIRFGSNPKDYPLVLTSWEGTMLYNFSPFIYGNNVENVAITGNGTIDGEAKNSWNNWKPIEEKDKLLSREMNHKSTPIKERIFGEGHFLRPQLIQFVNSKNILIEGVKVEDSPFWCVHLLKSKSITLRGIRYDAQNYNNDGIDIEYSSDVLIENIQFNNSDDNIAIKAGRDYEGRSNAIMPSENIVVRNCDFKGLHAIVIGSEMSAGVKNIYVNNCKSAGYLKRGVYLKTNSDRGGYIKNIFVSDVSFGKVEDCIYMTSNYHGEGSGLFPSKISDIYLSNISCNEASNAGIVIEGNSKNKVENIYFDTITIENAKNGITLTNSKNVNFNEIIIGEKQGVPSSVE